MFFILDTFFIDFLKVEIEISGKNNIYSRVTRLILEGRTETNKKIEIILKPVKLKIERKKGV